MEIDNLEKRWFECFASMADPAVLKKGFQDLSVGYSESHRYYHTLQHVCDCLTLLDEIGDGIQDRFCVEAAIWFHDVIYETDKGYNEEMSAVAAAEFFGRIGLASDKLRKIAYLILLTKHPSKPVTDDEKYLMDMDLAILGADAERYGIYETCIRKEYALISDDAYKKGRTDVLLSFLKADRLFETKDFRERFESRARENMERALKKL